MVPQFIIDFQIIEKEIGLKKCIAVACDIL